MFFQALNNAFKRYWPAALGASIATWVMHYVRDGHLGVAVVLVTTAGALLATLLIGTPLEYKKLTP